jgi:hypothetical protein
MLTPRIRISSGRTEVTFFAAGGFGLLSKLRHTMIMSAITLQVTHAFELFLSVPPSKLCLRLELLYSGSLSSPGCITYTQRSTAVDKLYQTFELKTHL